MGIQVCVFNLGTGKCSGELDRGLGTADTAEEQPLYLHQCRWHLHPERASGASAKTVGRTMPPGETNAGLSIRSGRWDSGRWCGRSMTWATLGPASWLCAQREDSVVITKTFQKNTIMSYHYSWDAVKLDFFFAFSFTGWHNTFKRKHNFVVHGCGFVR